jgi:hypothetical protein
VVVRSANLARRKNLAHCRVGFFGWRGGLSLRRVVFFCWLTGLLGLFGCLRSVFLSFVLFLVNTDDEGYFRRNEHLEE